MARISGPSDLTMDFVTVGELTIFLPVDLPEGGQLQIVIGDNVLAAPDLRVDLPRGAMVALLDSENAVRLVPQLKDQKLPPGSRAAELPNMNPYGLPLLRPLWIPEGGFLNVRVGEDVTAMPQPSTPLAKGALLAVLPPGPAELFRREFKKARGQNPYAITPNGVAR